MKMKVQISDITHEDLVNLLSTALYGSHDFGVSLPNEPWVGRTNFSDCTCIEDKLAKVLLNGKPIIIHDLHAEDATEGYGTVPHKWDSDEEFMNYTVSIDAVVRGLEKACNEGKFHTQVFDLMNDPAQLDMYDADILLQYIVFGEYIFG